MAHAQEHAKATTKEINIYIRQHPFLLSSIKGFTTSQRRAFIRNVYDVSRALGLNKRDAKQQTIKARQMCGEDEYDTDHSALENEIDDSQTILTKLQGSSVPATRTSASSFQSTTTLRQKNVNGNSHIKAIPVNGIAASAERVAGSQKSVTNARSSTTRPSSQSSGNLQEAKRSASDYDLDNKSAQLMNGFGFTPSVDTLNPPKRHRRKSPQSSQSSSGSKARRHKGTLRSSASFQTEPILIEDTTPPLQSNPVEGTSSTSNSLRGDRYSVVGGERSFDIPANVLAATATKAAPKTTRGFTPPDVVAFSDDEG